MSGEETEEQRRERFSRRLATINADERLTPALRGWVIEQETEVLERDLAEIRARAEREP